VLRNSPLECIIAPITRAQVREYFSSERAQAKKSLCHTGYADVAEMSSLGMARHSQVDTDSNRTSDHD
jgi:hypothetical protein